MRSSKRDCCEPGLGQGATDQPGDMSASPSKPTSQSRDKLPSKPTPQSPDKLPSKVTLQSPSKPTQSSQGGEDAGWPIFFDGEKLLPTEFKEDLWRCPFCDHWTIRIRQHLKTHQDEIPDWTAADNFCNEVSAMKRRRLEKKREKKRATDPKRKETLAKADAKRAADPSRQRDDPTN